MAKRPRKKHRADEDCEGAGFIVARVRKGYKSRQIEVCCPRCGHWQILSLEEDGYDIAPNGLVTPQFVCMASGRHCDFMDTIVVTKDEV